ncbi:MAG: hypothetical protein Aurels2KO_25310 [Aureliella sp.]
MALAELSVARVKKAAEKLPAPGSEEDQLDVAIRNSAEKNKGGKITVPSQLAERVDELLNEATPPPPEQPVATEIVQAPEFDAPESALESTPESDDEPVSADAADVDQDD